MKKTKQVVCACLLMLAVASGWRVSAINQPREVSLTSSQISESGKENNNIEELNFNETENLNFVQTVLNTEATKLVDLGWVQYIVISFIEGNIEDYQLYIQDGSEYKEMLTSNVDDNGTIVKWEIDELGYTTIKIKKKDSNEEGIYTFENTENLDAKIGGE